MTVRHCKVDHSQFLSNLGNYQEEEVVPHADDLHVRWVKPLRNCTDQIVHRVMSGTLTRDGWKGCSARPASIAPPSSPTMSSGSLWRRSCRPRSVNSTKYSLHPTEGELEQVQRLEAGEVWQGEVAPVAPQQCRLLSQRAARLSPEPDGLRASWPSGRGLLFRTRLQTDHFSQGAALLVWRKAGGILYTEVSRSVSAWDWGPTEVLAGYHRLRLHKRVSQRERARHGSHWASHWNVSKVEDDVGDVKYFIPF